ncbi:MAG: SpoIIE family protein phosphatase [Acidobacteria bacterium]|nr:SpoIIE family protein phosphatase [Acidobacteriota bacterium]MBV9069214.1 SpoIIE family protein phosphatase [Acidobacteriota bacterium]MBV9183967.1 SpoIIE family protein phosphatase [Acidobacteriota bacterium]
MKIRAQLVLACFLLSVLPLSVIVVYSYRSSRSALESAYRKEADARTRQMDRRLTTIRGDLQQRLAEVSALPMPAGASDHTPDVGNILMTMGDAASLVDSLEIQPMRVAVPAARTIVQQDVRHAPRGNPNAPPGVTQPPPPTPPPQADESADAGDEADTNVKDAPDAPESPEPVVIAIPPPPKLPKFTMAPEQRALINEISTLGTKLGMSAQTMSPEERTAAEKRIQQLQKDLNASLQASQSQWRGQFDAAQKEREQYFNAREQQREAALAARRHARDVARAQRAARAPAPVAAVAPAVGTTTEGVVIKRKLTDSEKQQLRDHERQATLLFGQKFNVPLRKEGTIVGHISAQVSTPEVVRRVLGVHGDDADEITFAIDRDNNVYTRNADDRKTLDRAGITDRVLKNHPLNDIKEWIVVMSRDPQSGLRVGVARPVGDNLEELRKTAGKNFGYGIALIFVALIGIVPIANHMTRDVNLVTRGAERIAQGDLMTRLPVKSNNEIGQLAAAFNRMAQDLSLQQQTIVEQERTRKEQEIQQRILELEYDRKSLDLEEARRFQLSMLPKSVPAHDRYDVAVFTLTAAEVGGDYYDFHVSPNGILTATVGDATGHGAKAGTMVTVVKALFSGYTPEVMPAEFLRDAAEKVKRMDLGRMAMALLLARFDGNRLTVASAGMLPGYVHRTRNGKIEEVARGATPLGTLGADYHDVSIDLTPGDTVLFMTDGFPELQNANGQQLGYAAAIDEFVAAAKGATADDVIASLAAAAKRWNGERPPNDDVTFVVVRAKTA